jgi:hypothetical protein
MNAMKFVGYYPFSVQEVRDQASEIMHLPRYRISVKEFGVTERPYGDRTNYPFLGFIKIMDKKTKQFLQAWLQPDNSYQVGMYIPLGGHVYIPLGGHE